MFALSQWAILLITITHISIAFQSDELECKNCYCITEFFCLHATFTSYCILHQHTQYNNFHIFKCQHSALDLWSQAHVDRSTDCMEAKRWGSWQYVLGSWVLTLQIRHQAGVFPDTCPRLLPAETQGHALGNAPKCSYNKVRACTYVRKFSSRPSCVDAGSWSSTNCLQCWGAWMCKPSLQNGIQNTSVSFSYSFFSQGTAKFCSTAQQLVCFHQQAFGQEVLFIAWSFLHLKMPLSEDSIGNLCKSHILRHLNFLSHNTFVLNEMSTDELPQNSVHGTSSADETKKPQTRVKHYLGCRQ